MTKVVLHQFPQSHYCIRIRWALAHKGISFTAKDYRLANLDDLLNITKGYRKVPVLEWDKQVVVDSPKIARFLESQQPTPTLFPAGTNAALNDMMIAWVDTKVFLTAAKWSVKDYLKFLGNDEDRERYQQVFINAHRMETHEAIARHEEWDQELLAHWALLEEALTQRSYLFGEQLSYADLGVASRLKLMNIVNGYRPPAKFANLNTWSEKIFAICP